MTDLLDDTSKVPPDLQVCRNNQDGYSAKDITRTQLQNSKDCVLRLEKGLAERKVSETSMNLEWSRSHTLLTLEVKSTNHTPAGVMNRHSCFKHVDLAGAERQKDKNTSAITSMNHHVSINLFQVRHIYFQMFVFIYIYRYMALFHI